MDYEQVVSQKLSAHGERAEELTALWESICGAYEAGGADQVETVLEEQVQGLPQQVRWLVEELRKQL